MVSSDLHGGATRLDSYQDAGFASPVNGLDTDALLKTSHNGRNQMVDEFELLQTDPEYTRDFVLALKADLRWDDSVSSSLKWEHVAGKFAIDAIGKLNMWHDLFSTCTELRTACQEHECATILRPGAPVSAEVCHTLAKLRQLFYAYQKAQMENLYTAILQMNAMKDVYCMRSEGGILIPCQRGVHLGNPRKPSDRIHLAFRDLVTAMSDRHGSKLSKFYALADQLSTVQSDERAHGCLSTLIQLDDLQLSVDWSQTIPRSPSEGSESHELFARSEPKPNFFVNPHDSSFQGVHDAITCCVPLPRSAKPLGPLLRAMCDHPWPKGHRGSLRLAKAKEAGRHATKFWEALRGIACAESKIQRPREHDFPARLQDFFSFDVSPDHLAAMEVV